ncbi:hypothetical protein BCM02_117102 [Paenibacillus methanolicus]|uniref:Uncharacterized protein n=1 Tax=Paenibacillus methanolicus TaxID=582686 RepID=A0A5S5BPV7_9BACL|nr:hypothetical protein BCM02_117102 [Paenibacillus methanolicus]
MAYSYQILGRPDWFPLARGSGACWQRPDWFPLTIGSGACWQRPDWFPLAIGSGACWHTLVRARASRPAHAPMNGGPGGLRHGHGPANRLVPSGSAGLRARAGLQLGAYPDEASAVGASGAVLQIGAGRAARQPRLVLFKRSAALRMARQLLDHAVDLRLRHMDAVPAALAAFRPACERGHPALPDA